MFCEKMDKSSLAAWICVSVIAPLSSGYNGNWLPVVIYCGIMLLFTFAFGGLDEQSGKPGKFLGFLQLIWVALILACSAHQSMNCWEAERTFPFVPTVLLILAAISAQHGAARAGAIGTILIRIVMPITVIVILAGLKTLRIEHLKIETSLPNPDITVPILLPCIAAGLAPDRNKETASSVLTAFTATILTIWITASLSEQIYAKANNPLIEYSKGITIFGSVKRFEAIVACVLTAGWFSYFSLLLTVAGNVFRGKMGVWFALVTAFVMQMVGICIASEVIALGTVLLFLVLPMLKNKMKKGEKSA